MTDDLTDTLDEPPLDLAAEIRGMREDFRDGFARLEQERIGRRGTNRLAALVVVGALLVAAFFGFSYVQQGRVTCETRIESRADVRAAIAVAIDEGAKELGAGDAERVALRGRVDAAVLKKLPPPDC